MKMLLIFSLILFSFAANSDKAIEGKEVSLTAQVLEVTKGCYSGTIICYHHVRYTVLNLCEGENTEPEILVAYVSVSGEEVDNLNVGDVVCLNALKTDKFKKDAEEIRKILLEEGISQEISDKDIPTHFGYSFIKNCQCFNQK